jgi:3-hydroxyacyl-CoA dehydrogenase
VIGLDVAIAIQHALHLELREPGFAPAPLLEHLVTAGYLGRKTGRGFRDYTNRRYASTAGDPTADRRPPPGGDLAQDVLERLLVVRALDQDRTLPPR